METALEFECWADANKAGYFTRTHWRQKHRRGVKRKAEATEVRITDKRKSYYLYHRDQTSKMSERVWCRGYLLDLFVGHSERFKATCTSDGKIYELTEQAIYGSARRSIERGFNYKSCGNGITVGWIKAESFHIYARDPTQFFVIDLDIHTHTPEAVDAHLELLARIEQSLPAFHKSHGGSTFFYQYRQQPSGIQIWCVLNRKTSLATLQTRFHNYLNQLGHDLDERLIAAGLPGLKQIEILPTKKHTISMVGAYGKEIFTNRILKPVDGRCDVVGLGRYLQKGKQPKSVLKRYGSLLRAIQPDPVPATAPPVTAVQNHVTQLKKGYVRDLFQKARIGVTQPDVLFAEYLAPLGQFLYFRDFRNDPLREMRTVDALYSWVLKKHNGHISRVSEKKQGLLKSQIECAVRRFDRTTGIELRGWYDLIQLKDGRYPQHYKSLLSHMECGSDEIAPSFLIHCKCQQKTQNSSSDNNLQTSAFPESLEMILATTELKTAMKRNRLKRFARKFLPLLYPAPIGLSENRINTLLGVKSRQASLPYKKELMRLGLIHRNWQRGIIRGKRSSVYRLTDLAWDAFHSQAENI